MTINKEKKNIEGTANLSVDCEQKSTKLLSSKLFSAHLKALRPKQWTKNLVVFAGPLFAFAITTESLWGILLAFCLFCATASSFYLINDIIDVKSDRQHPVKSKRPIASGLVAVPTAIAMAVILLTSALFISWWRSPELGITVLGYALLQVAYNWRLKHTVILDVVAIAVGFILRACGGAAATGIVLSSWLLLCTAMLALFLGIEKRKAELRLSEIKGKKSRAVLHRYSLSLLDRMEGMATNGTIITYALWSSGPIVSGSSTPWMILTLPFVLYGIFRYQFLSDPQEIARRNNDIESGGQTERPDEVLLNDKPILLTVLTWVLATLSILLSKKYGLIN
jgi:4-hydroxybenzoate polyprenyltransferase